MGQIPNFFRKSEKGEDYNNSDLYNQEPCLASLRWLGRLPDLFRHQLVAGKLIFILLLPLSLLFSGIVLDEPQILGTCNGCYGSRLLFPCHPNHGKVVQSLHTIDMSNACHTSMINSPKSHCHNQKNLSKCDIFYHYHFQFVPLSELVKEEEFFSMVARE